MEESDPSQPPREGEKGKAVVVILVGPPGSGKTTFCNDVMSAARRPWVRVCQDTIANGKAGTKSQCIKSATDALKAGKSVFIDRCNLDQEQRAEFVKLGGAMADVHAVVLDLPAWLCISRSVKRTGHEGNLQGGRAAAVVNRMLQKKELPKLREGFTRITFCHNENDVKDAVNTYGALGSCGNLISGIFGEKSADTKVQLGIMKFLKKVEVLENVANDEKMVTDGSNSQVTVPKQEKRDKEPCFMEIVKENENKNNEEAADVLEKSFAGDHRWNDVPTLAFPSISTSDFQFSHEKASDIIVDCVAEFLHKVDNVRLVLVDLSHKSNILSLVRSKAAKRNIDSTKFFTFVGDITRLHTEGRLSCNVIANAANWRLKAGGGGVNASIFNAAGQALEIATKERADTLSPGKSIVVPLPSSSPLYQKEGVTHVIHVLGPNMNPQRPNCLRHDYVKGCKVLREAYMSLFENFASLPQAQINQKESGSEDKFGSNSHDRLMVMTKEHLPPADQKTKREGCEGCYEAGRNKKGKGIPVESKDNSKHTHDHLGFENSEIDLISARPSENVRNLPHVTDMLVEMVQKNKKVSEATKQNWGSWAQALHQIAMHPEKHKDAVIEASHAFVVINDLYPKAKKHILVLSRLPGLDCLADIRKEHLPLLRKMHVVGLKCAKKSISDDSSLIFRLGYHSVPSMRQLHLHVISQDFDSTCLKNKKHWNSFNTSFFRDSSDVIDEVDKNGVATLHDDENLLSMELRCNRCRSVHPNIPRLKSHIANCKLPFPASLLQKEQLLSASSESITEYVDNLS